MRLTSFAIFSLFTAALVSAAERPETTTYIDGNLPGVAVNTGGTLLFSDEASMTFRTGLANIVIPYAGVTKAELGAVKETSHDIPLYKVWALRKRFGPKTRTQLLIVDFKNEENADKTMTLELSPTAASEVLETLQSRGPKTLVVSNASGKTEASAKSKGASDSWWGDEYWKTTRNSDKWNKPTATNAPENQ